MAATLLPFPDPYPRAPTQAQWDTLSDAERKQVVDALPTSVTDAELSPPEGDLHRSAKEDARDTLQRYFGGRGRQVYLGQEVVVYYPGERRFQPDLFVVFDAADHPRSRWVVSAEGKGLDFVMEVHHGGDRKKDAVRNVALYARCGIPEYFILDLNSNTILAYRLVPEERRYEPVLGQRGEWWSEVLELSISIEDGQVRFFDGSAMLLGTRQWVDRLERMVDMQVRRADDAARAEGEERQRREAAEAELERLRALLRDRGES